MTVRVLKSRQRARRAPLWPRLTAGAALCALWPLAGAQSQQMPGNTDARHWFTPYASLQTTLTDNLELNGAGRSADAVLRGTAGVSMRSKVGRVKGYADYSISALAHARSSRRNELQHQLQADMDMEWYDRQGFLRLGGSIQQVARSAFGAPVRADGLSSSNSTELRSFTVAPRWLGLLPGGLQISTQAQANVADASDDTVGDGHSTVASVRVSPYRPGPLSWALDAVHYESKYDQTRMIRSDRAYGSVIWLLPMLDLQANARVGSERSNFNSSQTRVEGTWGGGLMWQPSPRTRVLADYEERAFGPTHQLAIDYRTPRSIWRLSDSRDITSAGTVQRLEGDILNRAFLFDVLLAGFEPDFGRRIALMNDVLNGNATLLRGALAVDDRREASFGWRGPRFSVLVSHARTLSRRIDRLSRPVVDDLEVSTRVRQTVNNVLLAHKLSPQSEASLGFTSQTGRGDLAAQRSVNRGITLQWSGRANQFDTWALAYRYNWYETGLSPSFTENSVIASYRMQF